MATIQDYLNLIKNAIYGKDVRQAIHDGIQQCYYDGKAGSTDLEARQRLDSAEGSISSLGSRMSTAEDDIDTLDARVDQIVAPSGGAPSAAEVADGRIVDGVTYNLIGDAIRAVDGNSKSNFSWLNRPMIESTIIPATTVFGDGGHSVYCSVSEGRIYKFKIIGNINRFIVCGTNSVASGASYTMLSSDVVNGEAEKEFEYVADGTYSYILICTGYNYSSYRLDKAVAYSTPAENKGSLKIMDFETANDAVTGGKYIKQKGVSALLNCSISDSDVIISGSTNMYYVQMDEIGEYSVTVAGSFNRFGVYVGNNITISTPLTLLSFSSGSYTKKTYTFKNDGTYKYLILLTNYPYNDSACTVTAEFSNKDNSGFVKVNGINVLTEDAFDLITNGDYAEAVNGVRYSDRLPDINNKIISAVEGCNFDVFPMDKVGYYHIHATGDFNRFGVYVGENGDIDTTLTLVDFETASFSDKTYTYYNDGSNACIAIVSNYPYNDAKSNVTCEFCTLEDTRIVKINGFDVYTKKGIGNIWDGTAFLSNYVSPENVRVVTASSKIYALYDKLVEDYPDYVTKTVLGQDGFSNNIIQYEFTSGNYNSYSGVLRDQDTSIAKPKVLIISGIHGYERTSVMGTYQFFLDMCQGANNLLELRGNYDFKVIPLGDPWSFNNNTRTNGNGVNIDDNFDINWVYEYEGTQNFSGWSAADQPETQIIQSWINANTDAVLYIDHHNSGYENEVSYVGANDSYNNVPTFKRSFLDAMYKFMPYLQLVEGFTDDLYYAYTGHFNSWSSSYNYAGSKGLTGICLETSWNQNGSGLHSDLSIKTSAEVLGNTLKYYLEEN